MKKSEQDNDSAQESEEQEQQEEQEEAANADPDHMILYNMLNVKKEATANEIKKAYRKLALLKHPDKNPGDKDAAENFQKLQKAYSVLSDPKKRERYDQWGDDGTDTFNSAEWMNAYEYYRTLHPEISKDDFESFVDKYRGSEEEVEDLKQFYLDQEGDMRGLLENIIASRNEDKDRLIAKLEDLIKEGELEKFKKFDQTKKKIKMLPEETAEAAKEEGKMKKAKANRKRAEGAPESFGDLEKMILAKRDNAFGGFLNYMEDKYGKDGDEEEDEEEAGKKKSKKRPLKARGEAQDSKPAGRKKRKTN